MTSPVQNIDSKAQSLQLAEVQTEWLRRIEAEYRSAAATQHLTLWLFQLGAPSELLRLGLRIAEDELTHAELSAVVYGAAGGRAAPQLDRETLALARNTEDRLELDILRVVVEQFCLGETLAVRIFKRMRSPDNLPPVRSALTRILRDEVVHRDFGWQLLDWLLDTPLAPAFRTLIQAELPAMLARVRQNYGERPHPAALTWGIERGVQPMDQRPELMRKWGMLSHAAYAEAVEETFGRDYEARFHALGVSLPSALQR